MGLISLFKNQPDKVIMWNNLQTDVLFYQFIASNDDIKMASKLVIKAGQGCLLAYEGQILAYLEQEGCYQIKTDPHTFFTSLTSLIENDEQAHKIRIFFYRKSALVSQHWGTPAPVKYFDNKIGLMLEVFAHGTYSIKIEQSERFFERLVGKHLVYTAQNLSQLIITKLVPEITIHLASNDYNYYEVAGKLPDMSRAIKSCLAKIFAEYGIAINGFDIDVASFSQATLEKLEYITLMPDAMP